MHQIIDEIKSGYAIDFIASGDSGRIKTKDDGIIVARNDLSSVIKVTHQVLYKEDKHVNVIYAAS